MSRPSKNTDRLLLKAGLELASETGFAGLRVRQIAKKAKVNLGMFHYYFKTKNDFTEKMLQEFYEEFFRKFSLEISGKGNPKEKLRRALNALGKFTRDYRVMILMLLTDVIQGQKQIRQFAEKNVPRHVAIMVKLIGECQNAGLIKKMPVPFIVSFILGSVGVPNIVCEILRRAEAKKPFGHSLEELNSIILSDEAISQRVELALKAVS